MNTNPCCGGDSGGGSDADRSDTVRYRNLQRSRTFQNSGFAAWSQAVVGVCGSGLLGGRFVREAVLSGVGEVRVWDFDTTELANLGNQFGVVGASKVSNLVAECERIRPGRVHGFATDIRHASLRALRECAVLVDCSDDPGLAFALTEISNGLGRPLLRAAVDGSGQAELGRVLCSDGGRRRACQLCTYALEDVLRRPRTPCPGGAAAAAAATLAGGAVGCAVTGLTVLQAQRLVTENDLEQVLDRELLLDLSGGQLLSLVLERSANCLSGHRCWELEALSLSVEEASLHDVFRLAGPVSNRRDMALSVFLHPLYQQASCLCGCCTATLGTAWVAPPRCTRCGQPMQWVEETSVDCVSPDWAEQLDVLYVPLARLGVPAGALLMLYCRGQPMRRLVLP